VDRVLLDATVQEVIDARLTDVNVSRIWLSATADATPALHVKININCLGFFWIAFHDC
jgi:uncharacterized SAM-dependent methyltransferase